MAQGTIKKLIRERGFGFILPEGEVNAERDLFFHRTNVEGAGYDSLREGEQVTYELGADERRGTVQATRVQAVGTD
jgi:CspA family cold shock protein